MTFSVAEYEQVRRLGEQLTADTDGRLLGVRNVEGGYHLAVEYKEKIHLLPLIGEEVAAALGDREWRDAWLDYARREMRSSKTLAPPPPEPLKPPRPPMKGKPAAGKK